MKYLNTYLAVCPLSFVRQSTNTSQFSNPLEFIVIKFSCKLVTIFEGNFTLKRQKKMSNTKEQLVTLSQCIEVSGSNRSGIERFSM